MATTREALVAQGMRLFGERGYAATSVAQIEEAAGLSAGSGGLYRHFRSKEALLAAGIDRVLAGGTALTERLQRQDSVGLSEQVAMAARASLARMDEDRDVTRLLFRGLEHFPDLLERFGREEIGVVHQRVTDLLGELAGERSDDPDWAAVAAVLQGALVHHWLMTDVFEQPPTGVGEDRFVAALVRVTVALLSGAQEA